MPGLDYPFGFECGGCDAKTTITRADAGDSKHDPDSVLAVVVALEQREWARGQRGHEMFCPDCIHEE